MTGPPVRFIRSIFPSWDQAYAQLLLKRFDLKAEQKIKGLSHGQRVKATLLLVLARRPRLLVLDEPTTGLDPVARHEVLRELTDVMGDDRRRASRPPVTSGAGSSNPSPRAARWSPTPTTGPT